MYDKVILPFFQFRDLEGLGYRAVAFAFFEDDVQVSYTKACMCCVKNNVVDYIRSVIIAGITISSLIVRNYYINR